MTGDDYIQKQKEAREHENYLAWLFGSYIREAAWAKRYPAKPHEMRGEYKEPTELELRDKIRQRMEAHKRQKAEIVEGEPL